MILRYANFQYLYICHRWLYIVILTYLCNWNNGVSVHLMCCMCSDRNMVKIWNNGKGIPVAWHAKESMYVPSLIFGHLLTSSNYDDTEKKVTGNCACCSNTSNVYTQVELCGNSLHHAVWIINNSLNLIVLLTWHSVCDGHWFLFLCGKC